uniref:EF-hand domain-containing protein n=1 Tax=Pelagomonas calceolata TaxID=35677 RepID=A0A7S3ZZI0_9STRA|mmetsp:Transcript_1231/g.3396  ORF Transcript_1231/g.3396 Transcript_1231/m.3396 type:complete len:2226 (-) Transcript_1231:31-6708(-)
MGQVIGKGRIHADAIPFINLEPDRVEKLWSHYKLHSDGFALDPDALQHVLKIIYEDDEAFEQKCRALFAKLDTDRNDLIDALECLATLASASGMKPQRKLTFVFDLYDFSESGELLLDEVTLLLKSTVTGLCKISEGESIPSLKEFEDLARLALKLEPSKDGKAVRDVTSTISRAQFVAYAVANPTISSWLNHYDDLTAPVAVSTEFGLQLLPVSDEYDLYKRKGAFEPRPGLNEAPCLAKYAALTPKVPEGEEFVPRTATDASLELDYVFGFGAPGSRGSAAYTTGDDVAFHAAELAILRSSGDDGVSQQFVRAHDATVTALAVSSDGATVATGQRGDSRIVVWSSSTQSVLGVLKSHTGAVSLLAFSEDGKLASIDSNGGLCVWEDMKRVASASLTTPALGLCWTQTGFVTCSEEGVLFWTRHRGKYVSRCGLNGPAEAYTGCVTLPSGDVLTTTGGGGFVVWRGRNYLRSVDGAHDNAIADLSLVSGEIPLLATCEGSKVKIWKAAELEVVMQLDLTTIPAIGAATTVSLHKSGSKVLVGTSERELYELSALGEGALEPKDEEEGGPTEEVPVGELLNTIAIGPSGSGITDFSSASTKVATLDADGIGRDGTVVVLDLEAKSIVGREVVIGGTSCCLSPDGSQVLVGKENGSGLVFGIADGIMTQAGVLTPPEPEPEPAPEPAEGEEGEEPAPVEEPATVAPISAAQVCRWAEGTLALACGATVYLYGSDFAPKGSASLNADVTAMDFKADGSVLMVATADFDLAFISAEDGSTLPDRKGRNGAWATSTVAIAYGFKGVLASLPHSGRDDPLCYAASGNLCAVGNRFGSIDLLPYPCTEKSSKVTVSGHGAGVAGVSFYGDDGFVSAGLTDGCLILWKVESDEVEDDAAAPEEEEEEEDLGFDKYDATQDAHLAESAEDVSERIRAIRANDSQTLYDLEDQDGEDPTAAWRDAVVEGKGSSAQVVPVDDLSLEWVHGYSGQSMRGNARYASTGEVVYPAASLGLVLDKTAVSERMVRSQKMMSVHAGPITALTTLGDLCATSANASVLIWSSADTSGVQGFSLLHEGCSALAFSQDGRYLAAASCDDAHTLHVFGLGAKQGLVATASTGKDKILDVAFSKDATTIVYGASNSFGVCTLNGSLLTVKRGLFAGQKRQAVFCCAFVSNGDEEKGVVGTQSGSIFTLDGRSLAEENHSHMGGPCYTMWSCTSVEGESDLDSVVLVTGGYDGKVKLFSYDMELRLEFDARQHSVDGSVSSACLNYDRRKVLVGTAGSEIFEFATNDESDLNKGPLVSGHCSGSLKAVACHPILQEVATVGDDGYLRTWSLSSHKQLRKLNVGHASRALAFLPNGHEIGVGLGIEGTDSKDAGKVLIVSMLKPSLEIAKELKDANGAITCISFSPDGCCMAVGSADSNIYVYDTLNSFVLKCTCEGHSDIPRTLDYSSDSLRIMSTSFAEMRCHDARNGDICGYDATMEISDYDGWTAPLGWPVLGCYPPHSDATDINAVCKSSDSTLLATADRSGLVSLYRWPCSQKLPAKTYKGHGGGVAMCRFTPDGAYLATVGESDRCLLQWARRSNGSCAKSKGALPPQTMSDVPPPPDYLEPEDPSSAEPSELVAPSTPPQLSFCYGVPPQLNRVGYSTHGDIVLGLGSKGVVYDKSSHTMRFFSSKNLVSAFACSGAYGAVAEVQGTVHVFDAETGRKCGSLPPSLKAVSHLVFSDDGSTLVGVGVGLNKLLTVASWTSMSGRWEDSVAAAASPIPLTNVGFACWGGPSSLAIGGVGDTDAPDILFCDVSGKNVSQRKTQSLSFAAYTAGGSVSDTILAGTPSGQLEVWAGATEVKRTQTTEAHAGGVTCVSGNISAGRDGWVKVWSSDLECLRSYFVGTAGITSLAVSLTKIATVCDGALVEIVADSGCASTLLQGDGSGQCGLDEKDGTLCITGDGGYVRLFSSTTRQLKTAFSLTGFPSRACAFAPGESTHLAIGIGSGAPSLDVDGKFYVLDLVLDEHGVSLSKIAEGHNAKAYITCASYSPDGQTLALGAADNVIYLHGVNGSTPYELFAVFDKHEAPIRCLDFSSDSSTIRAVCVNNVLKSCKSASGDEVPLSDIAWATARCPVGALVSGLSNASDPPVACAVNDGTIVSASHFGSVSARVWPATDAASAPSTRGHGGPCASIVYASTVASAGAFDGCVLQWNVAPATAAPPPPPDPVVVTEVEPEAEDAPAEE